MKQKYILTILLSCLCMLNARAEDVIIGENSTSYSPVAPYFTNWKYSTVQMLYTPTDVGGRCTISSVAFKVATKGELQTTEMKIYMGHKSGLFTSTSEYVSSSTLKLVYSGSPKLGQNTGWEPITFNQGTFDYNGTDNLVIVVTKKCANYNGNLEYYSCIKPSGYVLHRVHDTDTSYGDVSSDISYAKNSNYYPPAIKITKGAASSTAAEITIGESATSTSNYVPYGNYWTYSTTQMLYKPSEITRSGTINSIAFKVAITSTHTPTDLKIYLGHKSSVFSGYSDYVRNSNLTLVYSGTPILGTALGWEQITFNQGTFDYNGTDNLVVVITRRSSKYETGLEYYYIDGSGCTLYRGHDSNSSYAYITNTSYSYTTYTRRPSVKIGFKVTIPNPVTTDTDYTYNGVTYTLHANGNATVKTLTASAQEVVIPSTVTYQQYAFKVDMVGAQAFAANTNYSVTLPSSISSVHTNAFTGSKALAVIWGGSASLTTNHISKMKAQSPNVLIYVSSSNSLYTSGLSDSTNVVVNSTAKKVVLRDGYDFHCPQQFYANNVSYTRNFQMTSGVGGSSSAGWESIALPFAVESIRHSTKGLLTPFYSYNSSSTQKPFWLYSWGYWGWSSASSISPNTPYIICFPNNKAYQEAYNVAGEITFSSTNVNVYKTYANRTDYSSSAYSGRRFYPSFLTVAKNSYIYNINKGTTTSLATGSKTPGSAFISNLRYVKPFEGYIYSETSNVPVFDILPFDDNSATGIIELRDDGNENLSGTVVIYDLKGQRVGETVGGNVEQAVGRLPKGVYVINGKKIIVR